MIWAIAAAVPIFIDQTVSFATLASLAESQLINLPLVKHNERFGGKITNNTFGSKLLLEGPLSKNQKSSFVFSGKTSYLDKSSEILYKEPLFDFDNKGLPYSYTDLYGKFSLHGNNGSKFNLFGFNFQDKVDYQNISELKWNSNGLGSEFILIPGGSPVLIEGDFDDQVDLYFGSTI